MAEIPSRPSLADLQAYQAAVCRERGWDQTPPLQTFLLFTEEIGELAKAIRNRLNIYQEKGKQVAPEELQGEFADVLSYLLELANYFEIDLTEVYRAKEAINAARDWGEAAPE
ncbi:MAG: MazG nucleotide pyrophosphohydrolase domain-containing protein [Bacteroidota bacterium]